MPESSLLNLILQAAHQAPSADNSQPWRLNWSDPTLSVVYDTGRVEGKTFPADNPATLLTMGAVLENIKQATEALGLSPSWQISTELDPARPVYFKVALEQAGIEKEISKNMIPLFKRHTNRFPYRSQALPDIVFDELTKMTVESSARIIIIDQPITIKKIAKLVRLVSEIRFRTREVHEWLAKSLRFGDSSADDGLDIKTLDLPPGGGAILRLISSWQRMQILNWFGAYKLFSYIDSSPIRQAPAIVAIVGPTGFQDVIAAGQLMERVWIALNVHGIAVQPYYVLADQLHRRLSGDIPPGLEKLADTAFEEAHELFEFRQGETLQMLLRIGYPKKTPKISRRLPIELVCTE